MLQSQKSNKSSFGTTNTAILSRSVSKKLNIPSLQARISIILPDGKEGAAYDFSESFLIGR
jgi:hypothetical protein